MPILVSAVIKFRRASADVTIVVVPIGLTKEGPSFRPSQLLSNENHVDGVRFGCLLHLCLLLCMALLGSMLGQGVPMSALNM